MSATNGYNAFKKEAEQLAIGDHAVLYLSVGKQPLPYKGFPKEIAIILALKFPNQPGLLKTIMQGGFDQELEYIAQAIREDGRAITIRPLYEFNGNWYPWHAYHKNNKPEDFIPAIRHIIDFFRREAPGMVKVDLNYNRLSAKGTVKDFGELYPGDDYVDRITISNYNRCGTNTKVTKIQPFVDGFGTAYYELIKISKRPIGIAEVATTDLCGVDRLQWYKDMLESIRDKFDRVDNITFFFETIPAGLASNTVPIQWKLKKHEQKPFNQLIDAFRHGRSLDYQKMPYTPTLLERLGEPQLPWSIYSRGEYFLRASSNHFIDLFESQHFMDLLERNDLNVLAGKFRIHFNQGIKWKLSKNSTFALRETLGIVVTRDDYQLWDGQFFLRTEGRLCKDSKTIWGENCVIGGASYIEYFKPAIQQSTSQISSDKETQFYLGIEMNFGGDWAN